LAERMSMLYKVVINIKRNGVATLVSLTW
jgi:hypothetical protein